MTKKTYRAGIDASLYLVLHFDLWVVLRKSKIPFTAQAPQEKNISSRARENTYSMLYYEKPGAPGSFARLYRQYVRHRKLCGNECAADEYGFLVAYPQGTEDSDGNNFFTGTTSIPLQMGRRWLCSGDG